jgi:hypothetical protein
MVRELSKFLKKLKGNSILHKSEQLTNLILFSQVSVIRTHIAIISWIISRIPPIYKYKLLENLTSAIDFKRIVVNVISETCRGIHSDIPESSCGYETQKFIIVTLKFCYCSVFKLQFCFGKLITVSFTARR